VCHIKFHPLTVVVVLVTTTLQVVGKTPTGLVHQAEMAAFGVNATMLRYVG
jgi:hypothetical protein